MNSRRTGIFLGVAAAVALLTGRAPSDTFTYTTTRRQVRVGIIASEALKQGNFGSVNPDPYVFYVLDSRQDLKPLGYEFLNPLAPSVITPEIYKRWLDRVKPGNNDPAFTVGSPESQVFKVGAKATKNMGAYWEVNLDTITAEELRQYDVLYLHTQKVNPPIAFNSETREKLRRFADSGGLLWVDSTGAMEFKMRSGPLDREAPFLFDTQFVPTGTGSAVIATPNHPLLTYPYLISQQEAQGLGMSPVATGGGYIAQIDTRPGAGTGLIDPTIQVAGGQTLIPLIWNTLGLAPAGPITPNPGWRPNVLVGQVGAGRLVMSCQDVGGGINDFTGGNNAGYGGNSAALAGEFMLAARPLDMKFAYNLVSWTGAQTTANTDVRRTGGNDERIGAVLETKWDAPNPLPGTFKVSGATYFRNCVFAVDGNLVLHCYDARPGQDLDGDGNADDGLPDYIGGASQDEIWQFQLVDTSATPGASAPTVFEFYDPTYISRPGIPGALANFNLRELVVVVLSDGTIEAVRAFPRLANPSLSLAPTTVEEWRISPATSALGQIPYPITNTPHTTPDPDPNADLPIPSAAWSEGVVFAAINTTNGGRVLAIDPREGRSALMPGPYNSSGPTAELSAVPDLPGMPAMLSSPTVGYVRDNASGAIDKIVYVSVANTATSVASIRAFWFGTRGEPLARINDSTWQSRADRPWFAPDPVAPGTANMDLRPRLYHTFRDPGGAYITQEFEYAGTAAQTPNPGPTQFSVEYVGNAMRVRLPAAVTTPVGAVATGDERNQFLVDYTLDWRVDPAKAVNLRVNARSTFLTPDVAASPTPPTGLGPTKVGGAPALTGDDLLAFTVATASGLGVRPNSGNGVLFAANEQHLRTKLRWAFTMHDGFSMPVNGTPVVVPPRLRQLDPTLPGYYTEFITGVQFFGTPAYKDGVLYAVGRGEIGAPGAGGPPVSVLCAFRANPLIRLRLNQRIDTGTPVRIRQVNVVKSQGLTNAFSATPGGSPLWVDLNPTQYTINYESGEITINSSSPTGTLENFVSTSLPFVVRVGNGPEQVIAGQTVDLNLATTARQPRMVGPAGVDNLLWYVAVPVAYSPTAGSPAVGFVSSSPAVNGNTLWMGTQNGYLLSFDTDPAARDPQFQANGAQLFLSSPTIPGVARPGALRQAELISAGNGAAMASLIGSPSATTNVMMANTYRGVSTLEDAFTVIADSKRIIEVNAAGDAVWSSDSSKTYGVAGGELPRYVFDPMSGNVVLVNAAQATGLPVAMNVPYSRPTVARRVGLNDLIVVDTGNNRVVQIDRGGSVVWEVHRLFNNLGLLRPGDPLTLSEPTDVQQWSEFLPAFNISADVDGTTYTYNGPAYVVHYLISDTGNFRVIELIDAYDPSGNPIRPQSAGGGAAPFVMLRQTWFVSSSYALFNKRYQYRSVQRVLMRNSDLPAAWQDATRPIRQLTLTAIANARLSGAGPVGVNVAGDLVESGGGSLVVLNEQGNPLSIISNLRIPDPTNAGGYRIQPIVNPTWFSKFDEVETRAGFPNQGRLVFRYLLADDNGVYQLEANSTNPQLMDVQWLLSADDYYWMTGKRLRAASVRRLSAAAGNPTNQFTPALHQFLIANRFSGEDNPRVFGITYNAGPNPALGNIAGSSAIQGEAFVVSPRTFDITLPGATRNAPGGLHGYQPSYLRHPTYTNSIVVNANASVIWTAPTEKVPRVPDPATGFVGDLPGFIRRTIGDPSRATSSSLLVQPAYADRPY